MSGVSRTSAAADDVTFPSYGLGSAARWDEGEDEGESYGLLSPERRFRYLRFRTPGLMKRLASLGQPILYTRVEHGPGIDPEAPAESAPRVTDRSTLDAATQLELAVEPPQALSVAQFAVRNEVPVNIVLPLHWATHNARCDLRVTFDRDGDIDPVAVPTGSPEIQLIAGYMRTGQVEAAAQVTERAEYVLQRKKMNPIAAALGGYALLRVGATTQLRDWPANLANWFGWLPDGPVIAGEQAAREGDDVRAAQWFAEALRRGYPMFSDGPSLLASRVRHYMYSDETPAAILEREDDARRLVRMVPFVDFSQLAVTFNGLDVEDPAGSQEPLSRRAARAWTPLKAAGHASAGVSQSLAHS